jgi:hypothetical protein
MAELLLVSVELAISSSNLNRIREELGSREMLMEEGVRLISTTIFGNYIYLYVLMYTDEKLSFVCVSIILTSNTRACMLIPTRHSDWGLRDYLRVISLNVSLDMLISSAKYYKLFYYTP